MGGGRRFQNTLETSCDCFKVVRKRTYFELRWGDWPYIGVIHPTLVAIPPLGGVIGGFIKQWCLWGDRWAGRRTVQTNQNEQSEWITGLRAIPTIKHVVFWLCDASHIWIFGYAETAPRHISRFQCCHSEKSTRFWNISKCWHPSYIYIYIYIYICIYIYIVEIVIHC